MSELPEFYATRPEWIRWGLVTRFSLKWVADWVFSNVDGVERVVVREVGREVHVLVKTSRDVPASERYEHDMAFAWAVPIHVSRTQILWGRA